MSGLLFNILIGLVTSVISGGGVWLWERGKRTRSLHRKAAFFGLEGGAPCVVVMSDKYSKPGSVARHDVHAVVDVVMLGRELGSPVSIRRGREFTESNGARTEFCIGGPISDANPRTGGHLATYLPGVTLLPYGPGPDSMAFLIGGERFRCDRRHQERALVAKFRPDPASRPIFVVCGHTSIANRAAVHFMTHRYQELARALESAERFCVVIKLDAIETYGYEAASLERDVTLAAFTAAAS
ncbi:hypothetical protein [Actinomadura roseirufa]|uniref:hypothetical protein n=1 Tax=Actinomadura roseirufa TaxID=2094049 RepID=UPI00104108C1|nr:hypothetical protein [Actinomadura roseirufa]